MRKKGRANIPQKNLKCKDAEQEKWRNDMTNIVTRDREIDSDLRRQINEDTLHICEKLSNQMRCTSVSLSLLV